MKPRLTSRIKIIPVAELTSGMVVHDPSCDVHDDSPYRYHFRVANAREVDRLRHSGVHQIYINTALGKDLPGAPTLDELRQTLETELQELAQGDAVMPAPVFSTSQDVRKAAAAYDAARSLVRSLLSDFRRGRPVAIDALGDSVTALADAMLACPPPLTAHGTTDAGDDCTLEHSLGVCTLLIGLCQTMRLDRDVARQVGIGGLLHDVGHAHVPLDILRKAGVLSEAEMAAVKRHVEHGVNLIGAAPWLSAIALETIAQHHERADGSGYPCGLHSDATSLYGRMAAIADVYEAITSERAYRKAIPPAEALRLMHAWGKSHFDPELTRQFIRSIGIYPLRTLVHLESNQLAIVVEQNPQDLLRPVVRVVYDTTNFAPLPPRDIDLALSANDRIQGIERAEVWGIDVGRYLFN